MTTRLSIPTPPEPGDGLYELAGGPGLDPGAGTRSAVVHEKDLGSPKFGPTSCGAATPVRSAIQILDQLHAT